MDENMQAMCLEHAVNFFDLLEKIDDGLKGVSIPHFTDGELQCIKAALVVAGGL